MRCPFCTCSETQVLETRDAADALRRRRQCNGCGQRFTTYERVESLALCVRKRDGRREPFDRDKLMRGLVRAAYKRPLEVGELEGVVDAVAGELRSGGGELDSDHIGELVLTQLGRLDPVASVRFASVYRNFADAAEFASELERLSVRSKLEDAQLPPKAPRVASKRLEIATKGEE